MRFAACLTVFAVCRAWAQDLSGAPDGATIHGGALQGGAIDSHGDHRIAMAFAVAAQRAAGPVAIHDVANVATSFPGFDRLAKLAGMGLEVQ